MQAEQLPDFKKRSFCAWRLQESGIREGRGLQAGCRMGEGGRNVACVTTRDLKLVRYF